MIGDALFEHPDFQRGLEDGIDPAMALMAEGMVTDSYAAGKPLDVYTQGLLFGKAFGAVSALMTMAGVPSSEAERLTRQMKEVIRRAVIARDSELN